MTKQQLLKTITNLIIWQKIDTKAPHKLLFDVGFTE